MTKPCTPIIHSKHREKWLEARLEGVGASDVAALLGHGRSSPLELYALKAGQLEPDSLDDVELVRWGHVLEPIVVYEYGQPYYANRQTRRNGWLVQSTKHPWAMCTIDAYTNHPEFGLIPLEIKTTSAYREEDWIDGAPAKYHWQVAHQMMVTDTPAASIACLIGGQRLVWDDIIRSEADETQLIEAGGAFWDAVKSGNPPTHVDGSDSTKRALNAIYPQHAQGKVCQMGGVFMERDAELQLLKKQLKIANERKGLLENQIKLAMADAETAVLPDGTRYTLKTQTRGEHLVKESTFRVLRRKKANG